MITPKAIVIRTEAGRASQNDSPALRTRIAIE
jgi:hypothetical protein